MNDNLLQEEIVIPKGIWDSIMQELTYENANYLRQDCPPVMMNSEQAYYCGEDRIRKSILRTLKLARELQPLVIRKTP